MKEYKIEMRVGQDQRIVKADRCTINEDWTVFLITPPQGGIREYWRVKTADIISMETRYEK